MRPDVAHVEDERRPLEPRVGERRDADRKGRGLNEDDVDRPDSGAGGQGCQRERHPIEDAFEKARVGRCEDPAPQYADTVNALLHREPATVSLVDNARRIVRKSCDHGDLVAKVAEPLGELEHPGLRRADLGREVVRQEHDPQRAVSHAVPP